METRRPRLTFTLTVLFLINFLNFYDRQVLGAVGELVKNDWKLSDKELSSLTTAFILLYALVGLPLGHWADLGRRNIILGIGVLIWSAFTALSGRAWNFTSLVCFRLGVGVGEASCAPAANSLIGDLFPAHQRARALALFMLGLPLGLGLSYVASGYIAQALGWKEALLVAGAPGLVMGIVAFYLPEAARGSSEQQAIGATRRQGSSILAVLRIPTMWWIILSGALLNLTMYALGSFSVSLLMRYHFQNKVDANWISGVVYGVGGGMGMMGGGWLCDRVAKWRVNGRLQLAALAMMLATPCFVLALQQPRGQCWGFAAWFFPACMCLYVYYAAVYASIQDIVEPTRRGTAMAVYFFVFYMVAAAGLYAFGWLSDTLAQQALAAGASLTDATAFGLHDAMYVIPAMTLVLVFVLFAAAKAIVKDHQNLQQWMAEASMGNANKSPR
jgi:predicted MFS family arabinose efflux permease